MRKFKNWSLTIVMSASLLFLLITIDRTRFQSDVATFFKFHSVSLLFFLAFFVLLSIISASNYLKTLDFWEAETLSSIKAIRINRLLWGSFWLTWSIYCSWLYFYHKPMTNGLFLLITAFAIVPGLLTFYMAWQVRKEEAIQNEEGKYLNGELNENWEPYTISTAWKHYSGTYGLLCIPIYIITLIFGYFIY